MRGCVSSSVKQSRCQFFCGTSFSTRPRPSATCHRYRWIQTLPMRVTPDEARQVYDTYHGGFLRRRPALTRQEPEKQDLPFYLFDIDVLITYTAHIGKRKIRPVFSSRGSNKGGGGVQWETVVEWKAVGPLAYDRLDVYTAAHPAVQIYAGSAFRRLLADQIAPKDTVASPLFASLWRDWLPRPGIDYETFTIGEMGAKAIVVDNIIREEEKEIDQMLRREFSADEVRHIQMRVHLLRNTARRVYVPAYAFRMVEDRTPYVTLVSGVQRTQVAGQQFYSREKFVTASMLTGAAVSLALHTSPLWSALWGVVGYYFARYWPLIQHQRRLQHDFSANLKGAQAEAGQQNWTEEGEEQRWDPDEDQRKQQAWWDEFIRQATGGAYHQEQRYDPRHSRSDNRYQQQRQQQHQSQQQQQQQQQRSSRSEGSRGGYGSAQESPYAVLGVSPNASEADIKKAFRQLARTHHPDMVQGEAEKAKAKVKFQKITAAYEALKPRR